MLQERYSVIRETELLKPIRQLVVPARTDPLNLSEYFRTRSGSLYVWNTFRKRFNIENCELVQPCPMRYFVALLLKKDIATHRDIRKELPKDHLTSLSDIMSMIEATQKGEEIFFQADGTMHIFYVNVNNDVVCPVDVHRHPNQPACYVHDWDPGGVCVADDIIICPGIMSSEL